MGALLCDSGLAPGFEYGCVPDAEVSGQVWGLLCGMYPQGSRLERRQEQRYPYPRLVWLTPVQADGRTPAGEMLTVAGKHLSETGLGFYHPEPLSYRLVIASLEQGGGTLLHFLLDMNWCRFTRHGWYESGGRFLRAVSDPRKFAG